MTEVINSKRDFSETWPSISRGHFFIYQSGSLGR